LILQGISKQIANTVRFTLGLFEKTIQTQ